MTEPTTPVLQDPLKRQLATPFPDFRGATDGGLAGPRHQPYHDARRWNGWGMPFFTLEAGKQLASLMPDLRYVQGRDTFIHTAPELDGEDLECFGQVIVVGGRAINAYAIGAGIWCWDCPEQMA